MIRPRSIAVLAITLATLALSMHSQAELTARLSAPQIDETQTLELTIRTDSRNVQGRPDLKGVQSDFEILTVRKNEQYRVMNGNVQQWTDWIIALRPLRTGTLRIPPLPYRGEETKPLELKVIPLDPAIKQQMGNRVFFETSTEPEKPFVQAQVVFVRRLLYAEGTQIYGEMPDTPTIEDAVVIALGNATSKNVTRNNQRYGMIEQRYAIFPERSGTLTIPGAVVSGSVRMNVRGRLRRNGVRVIAQPMELNVRPIPDDYPPDTPWLPATQVDLLEAWDSNPVVFAQGRPLTQTLIVRSDAATGSIIPPLDYEIPASHFRSYPEQPDIADNQQPNGIIGTRSQTWSLIPTQEGAATLPAVELTWFDTVNETVRTATLEPRRAYVQGDSANTSGTTPEPESAADSPATPADPAAQNAGPEAIVTAADRRVVNWLYALAAVVVLAFLLWRCRHLLQLERFKPKRLRLREQRDALTRAISEGTPADIRQALESTSALYATLGQVLPDAPQKQLLNLLAKSTYAPTPTELDRTQLHAVASELFTRGRSQSSNTVLPALYPNNG